MSIRTGALLRAYASQPLAAPLVPARDAAGRVWCQLFPLDTWHRGDFPDEKWELTAEVMNAFVANWRAGGSPPLPVDYNHEEDGPAAGWIEDLRVSQFGLEGAIKWTDDAAAEIRADKRRYLSPTWSFTHVNRRTGGEGGVWLYGAALLNDPFFDSMPRVAASAASAAKPTPHLENTMNEEQLKALRAKMGLAEGASVETILAAVPDKKLTAAQPDIATAIKAAMVPVEEKLKASQEETEKLKESLLDKEVEVLVEAGKREGKALDPLKPFIQATAKASGIEEAKKMIAAIPATVPLKAAGTPGTTTEAGAEGDAKKKFEELVAEKVKAGATFVDATRQVTAANRELASKVFTTSTSNAA